MKMFYTWVLVSKFYIQIWSCPWCTLTHAFLRTQMVYLPTTIFIFDDDSNNNKNNNNSNNSNNSNNNIEWLNHNKRETSSWETQSHP